jgi:energy-coupling factor transporter ATP-binding protein EcfA2
VGLGYLVLRQPGYALSGGEAQRLKIAAELAHRTPSGTLYILDEPTVGQHMQDVGSLVGVLHALVEQGGSALVIEHHPHLLAACDWLVELGPGGGPQGGRVIASRNTGAGLSPGHAYRTLSAPGAGRCSMTWIALLLADPSACLRALVLRELLERPMDDAELQQLIELRADDSLATALLALQNPDGSWGEIDNPTSRFESPTLATTQALARLGYLGFDRGHPAVQRGADYLFSRQRTMEAGPWSPTAPSAMRARAIR